MNVSLLLTLLGKYGLFIWGFPPPSTLLSPCVRIRLHRLKMLGRHTEITDKGPSHCTHSRYVIVDQVRSASRLAPALATETRRPMETTITLYPRAVSHYNLFFGNRGKRESSPYLYPQRKTPIIIDLLVLLACRRHSMGSGMSSIQRSIIVLGIAVPRNQLHCEKQCPPLTGDQDFSIGMHWKNVERHPATNQAAFKVPTTQSAT